MTLYNWNEMAEEELNSLLGRRMISGRQITMARITLRKGCIVPTHSHENEQFSTTLTGALKFIVAGAEVIVRAGETLHIPPHTPHSAEAIEDTDALDVFSPVRRDWIDGDDAYLRGGTDA